MAVAAAAVVGAVVVVAAAGMQLGTGIHPGILALLAQWKKRQPRCVCVCVCVSAPASVP